MSVFNAENRADHTKALAFLDPDGGVTIQRFEKMKYPFFDGMTQQQLGFFWKPEEVDTVKDGADFKKLSPAEQHIFTSNLKRQILLDSVQGRSPTQAFAPLVSLPELEGFIQTWAFSEMIHSRSYTHIIRNVYPDPSVIFDQMMDIGEIVDCAKDISEHYDNLINLSMAYQLLGEGQHVVRTRSLSAEVVGEGANRRIEWTPVGEPHERVLNVTLFELKKALWLAIMSVNILEGVRFYVSFACSWAFAQQKKMEGNAKIIKLICRDENLHLGVTQFMLKMLPKDDPDYERIREMTHNQCISLFEDAVRQEKEWAAYLFRDGGSMLGLNYELLASYVEYIADERMSKVGYGRRYGAKENPLPWTKSWIAGSDVQVAPQETEITSYRGDATKQDVKKGAFSGITL
jgi:ribonucleoside-diphosphate reductase beta chain